MSTNTLLLLWFHIQAVYGLRRIHGSVEYPKSNQSVHNLHKEDLSESEKMVWQGLPGLHDRHFHVSIKWLRHEDLLVQRSTIYLNICVISLVMFMAAFFSRNTQPQTTHLPKEILMAIGIITTFLQGGGLIFGFSPFADKLLKMSDSRYTSETIPEIFAIGHQITALGCIMSGPLMDFIGPRRHAMLGLLMEAIGLLLLAQVSTIPPLWTIFAYGLVGWGGCHVLMAALTLVPAFEQANLMSAILTVAFQFGGFIFMVLPFVRWEMFFNVYGFGCLAVAVLFGCTFPDTGLPSCTADGESVDNTSLKDILLRPSTTWFLITFMVAGNALIYGISEFPSALTSKDTCHTSGSIETCDHQDTQDYLNNIAKPIIGNFILPLGMLIGYVIDKWGFCMPAIFKVLSVQVFIATLWLLDLESQIWTVLAYNAANSLVFTIQNAYICSFHEKHVGSLFAASNFVLGIGNILTDWLSLNPFDGDTSNGVSTSLTVSCVLWILACSPLYIWGVWAEKNRTDVVSKQI